MYCLCSIELTWGDLASGGGRPHTTSNIISGMVGGSEVSSPRTRGVTGTPTQYLEYDFGKSDDALGWMTPSTP